MITKYGYSTVGTITVIVFVLITAAFFINNQIVKWLFIILPSLFMVFTLYFFRDPDRTTPVEEKAVISPADGKIIILDELEEKAFFGERVKKISIFMSPLNVHVNRIPIDGTVKYLNYHEGEFSAAFLDKASEKNERMEVGIESAYGKIKYVQIAGAIARRIVCTLKQEQKVKAGDKFGMIKFGSRVDVYLPLNAEVCVKMNDIVRSGETILARMR